MGDAAPQRREEQNAGSETSGKEAQITCVAWPCAEVNGVLCWRQNADVVLMTPCFIIRLNKRRGARKNITIFLS